MFRERIIRRGLAIRGRDAFWRVRIAIVSSLLLLLMLMLVPSGALALSGSLAPAPETASMALIPRLSSAIETQAHFTNCAFNTGTNASVAIQSTVTVISGFGFSFAAGDEIAVFTPDGSICAGVATWDGSNLALTVWGDDSQTTGKDGMAPGDEMLFWIWDQSEGVEYPYVRATYSTGDGIFNPNSIYIVATFDLGGHFTDCVTNTGNNGTVLFPSDLIVLGDVPLEAGDEIAAFNPAGTVCAGRGYRSVNNDAVTVWGDDSQTAPVDGLLPGETIHWYVWDASQQIEYQDVAVTYRQGDGLYAPDSIQILDTIDVDPIVTQEIPLAAGWNMVSSYVEAEDPSLDPIFAPLPSLTLVKNGAGNVYWPSFGINQIGSWNVKDGYQIHMGSAGTLSITGRPVKPEETPISVAAGWNLIAYLRDSALAAGDATASIANEIYLAKNGAGEVYWPAYGINQIGNMAPGEGYQLYMNTAGTLTYPAN